MKEQRSCCADPSSLPGWLSQSLHEQRHKRDIKQ